MQANGTPRELLCQNDCVAVRDAEKCRTHLDRISSALPETTQRPGDEKGLHIAFVVRKKTFAYFTIDHHCDGRLALTFRAPAGEQAALVASEPDRFFVPPYLTRLLPPLRHRAASKPRPELLVRSAVALPFLYRALCRVQQLIRLRPLSWRCANLAARVLRFGHLSGRLSP